MSMTPMIVTMGIVIAGVWAAAPGVGMLMAIVFAVALIALRKELHVGAPSKLNAAASADTRKGTVEPPANSGINLALKILAIALSSVIAVLVSTICVFILAIISLLSAISAFFEACVELLPKQ